jgi:hypothetical protein
MKTVIEMAREAGAIPIHKDYKQQALVGNENIERFAELVRAEEREACAKVCDRIVEGKDPDDIHSDSQWAALSFAVEIRARGNK